MYEKRDQRVEDAADRRDELADEDEDRKYRDDDVEIGDAVSRLACRRFKVLGRQIK